MSDEAWQELYGRESDALRKAETRACNRQQEIDELRQENAALHDAVFEANLSAVTRVNAAEEAQRAMFKGLVKLIRAAGALADEQGVSPAFGDALHEARELYLDFVAPA